MSPSDRGKKKSGRSKLKGKAALTLPRGAATEGTEKAPVTSIFSWFPVVGVGASAGGLAAVTELLKHLPAALGAAVVIIQHLDPKHGSLTTDILSRVSSMPVAEVKDGMRPQPGHVYVMPPNKNMALSHGVLKLSPRSEGRGQHLPINLFFKSLADDRTDHAVGVVLSGMASDGTMGVKEIKAKGGFTFAQDPTSAQFDGMPRSAISSGAVDIVGTPKGIAKEIAKMSIFSLGRSARPGAVEQVLPLPRGPNGNLRKLFASIQNATGVDFTHYKQSTIQRRIARRLLLLKIDDMQSYVPYVGSRGLSNPQDANPSPVYGELGFKLSVPSLGSGMLLRRRSLFHRDRFF
jgi:two-component system CheB/CheR fusion protein